MESAPTTSMVLMSHQLKNQHMGNACVMRSTTVESANSRNVQCLPEGRNVTRRARVINRQGSANALKGITVQIVHKSIVHYPKTTVGLFG